MPELQPATDTRPATLARPRVLVDPEDDLWASWDDGQTYHYISPYVWGPGTPAAELIEDGACSLLRRAVFDHWATCGACQDGLTCPVGDPLWEAAQHAG